MTGSDFARIVEISEAAAYARLIAGAPAALSADYGLAVHRFGSARALVAPGAAGSLMLNRVIGVGLDAPASDEELDAIEALYRDCGVDTHAVELSPAALPTDLSQRLMRRGYVPFKRTVMMVRDCQPIGDACAAAVDVRHAGAAQSAVFSALCCEAFQLGQPFSQLLEASFDDAGWHHWLAWNGNAPVAAAMACIDGDVAWIGWVCTLASHRGRGAQKALAATQLRELHRAGARFVTLEAAAGTRRRPGTSLSNYQRLGWTTVNERPVYLRRLLPGAGQSAVARVE